MRSLAAEVLPDLEEQDGKTRPWGRWAQHDLLEGPASVEAMQSQHGQAHCLTQGPSDAWTSLVYNIMVHS